MLSQVIDIEPKNEDAYIGCCELLKADGKNLEAVAVYCKCVQSDVLTLVHTMKSRAVACLPMGTTAA